MAEYTYEDIIMDPKDPRLEGAIGKECYFGQFPKVALDNANKDFRPLALEKIDEMSNFPFYMHNDERKYPWPCIILRKEEPKPKFIPFSNENEFIAKFNSHTMREDLNPVAYVLLKYGMWLKCCESGRLRQVSVISKEGIRVADSKLMTWYTLLASYTFIEGTPCGKEVEE